ncbi:MAG: SIMPL domain-containing protein [Acidobacteria bacterium]|nr:SIMPL domain-containing protein [Acidobacteriota bacterium]
MKILKTILISLILFSAAVYAQDGREAGTPSIRTNGEAMVTAQPDRARIDIGVTTEAATSQSAVSQNAEALEATLTRLRQLLGANANIKTIGYTLTPNYRYPKDGGERTLTGYTATNIVRVTMDDLTKVGSVIDAATQAGANRVNSLEFSLKNENTAKDQALREAALDARRKADALAAALGLKIVRVLTVVENGPIAVPVRNVAFARSAEAATPIEPGMIEIRAQVSVTVEIG